MAHQGKCRRRQRHSILKTSSSERECSCWISQGEERERSQGWAYNDSLAEPADLDITPARQASICRLSTRLVLLASGVSRDHFRGADFQVSPDLELGITTCHMTAPSPLGSYSWDKTIYGTGRRRAWLDYGFSTGLAFHSHRGRRLVKMSARVLLRTKLQN